MQLFLLISICLFNLLAVNSVRLYHVTTIGRTSLHKRSFSFGGDEIEEILVKKRSGRRIGIWGFKFDSATEYIATKNFEHVKKQGKNIDLGGAKRIRVCFNRRKVISNIGVYAGGNWNFAFKRNRRRRRERCTKVRKVTGKLVAVTLYRTRKQHSQFVGIKLKMIRKKPWINTFVGSKTSKKGKQYKKKRMDMFAKGFVVNEIKTWWKYNRRRHTRKLVGIQLKFTNGKTIKDGTTRNSGRYRVRGITTYTRSRRRRNSRITSIWICKKGNYISNILVNRGRRSGCTRVNVGSGLMIGVTSYTRKRRRRRGRRGSRKRKKSVGPSPVAHRGKPNKKGPTRRRLFRRAKRKATRRRRAAAASRRNRAARAARRRRAIAAARRAAARRRGVSVIMGLSFKMLKRIKHVRMGVLTKNWVRSRRINRKRARGRGGRGGRYTHTAFKQALWQAGRGHQYFSQRKLRVFSQIPYIGRVSRGSRFAKWKLTHTYHLAPSQWRDSATYRTNIAIPTGTRGNFNMHYFQSRTRFRLGTMITIRLYDGSYWKFESHRSTCTLNYKTKLHYRHNVTPLRRRGRT